MSTTQKKQIIPRAVELNNTHPFGDIHPVLERIFLARGIQSADELNRSLSQLPSPLLLSGMDNMLDCLVTALKTNQHILILADYDADGATSCALAIRGLKLLGFNKLSFVVPDRFKYGYGLTPEIVELIIEKQPDIILTVDNGISSIEGVNAAHSAGIKVFITDHHLTSHELPNAEAIVNPNVRDDLFPSKALAGVGVMFYVLMALRARLRELNWFVDNNITEPNLAQLLDLVALGTVADVAVLDKVNRVLVHQGLIRIRNGQAHAGINALIEIANKNPAHLNTSDLGFTLAPRLNAAGRMDDMAIGIRCLLTDDLIKAKHYAFQLDEFNNERREVEGKMKQEALALLSEMKPQYKQSTLAGLCLYEQSWHQGVIGILAARIKDQIHRPVIVFASAGEDLLKGSARSIVGVHIRDVLSDIATQYPKLIKHFGGHAMAAGLTLHTHNLPEFALVFDEMVQKRLIDVDLNQKIYSDGKLKENELTVEFADLLQNAATWGQGFAEPIFHGKFEVIQVRIVGQHHLKLVLRLLNGDSIIDAIAFFIDKPENYLGMRQVLIAYKLDVNEYRGNRSVQLIVQYLEKII